VEYTQRILKEIPDSIEAVKPHVNFFCTIENAGTSGDFVLGEGITWEQFTLNFQQEVEVVGSGNSYIKDQIIMTGDGPKQTSRSSDPDNNDNKKHHQCSSIITPIPQQQPMTIVKRLANAQETRYAAKSFRLRRRSFRKPFCVNVSTEENHGTDDRNFFGKYSHIRATLDYTYHKNYTYERQKFQDAIITEFLHGAVITDKDGLLCTTPTQPWVVFTAGAMGAGKSHLSLSIPFNQAVAFLS
jgi:hypothetical protein